MRMPSFVLKSLLAARDDFSRIQDVFRIERRLDAAHERSDLRGERFAQIRTLRDANAMFAADLPTQFARLRVQIRERDGQPLLPRVLVQVVAQDVDVQVAVAGMAEGADH